MPTQHRTPSVVAAATTTPEQQAPRPWWCEPYPKFHAATVDETRVRVDGDARSQAVAALLIKQGMCGYRDFTGRISDIGVPKRRRNRKRIWKSTALDARSA